ncbi:MAG TPA: hypothetical protein VMV50_02660 [Candidatus Paceibacterota bacterium]|nr:hypothetical protein [Candidatus Paceibacterota bacterium]
MLVSYFRRNLSAHDGDVPVVAQASFHGVFADYGNDTYQSAKNHCRGAFRGTSLGYGHGEFNNVAYMHMKRLRFMTGALALLLVLSLASTAAAQGAGGGGGAGAGGGGSASGGGTSAAAGIGTGSGAGTQDQDRIQQQDQIRDPSTHTGTEPDQIRLQTQDQDRLYQSTTSTTTAAGAGSQAQYQGGAAGNGQGAMNQAQTQYRLQINPEHIQLRASSGAQLGQMIQAREQQLEQEVASSTPDNRAAIQSANQVRLGVHALLAAQNLLGPVGPQVAQIASQIDTTVNATANAQAQIGNRGFLTRLFFGGDAQAAGVIAQATSQNQAQLQTLAQLIGSASTTPAVQATLQTQLQSMQQEQERLQELSASEQGQWGLFSWRF